MRNIRGRWRTITDKEMERRYQTPYNSFEDPYKTFRQEYPIPATTEAIIQGECITDILHLEGYEDQPWFGDQPPLTPPPTDTGTGSGFGWDDIAALTGTVFGAIKTLKSPSNVTYNQLSGQTAPAQTQTAPPPAASSGVPVALIAGIGGSILLILLIVILKRK